MAINKSERGGSALIVIDVQVNVVADAFERDAKVANMATAVAKARAASVPVIWVRHTSMSAFESGYDITLIEDAHTTTGFEWNGYVMDAARTIDEQNTNFMGYSLPTCRADVKPVGALWD